MKYKVQLENYLVLLISLLCIVLILNLLYRLRSILPWRANCWFCNNNFWVKLPERNSWTCPNCEQYNGFTKDGDYNKQILSSPTQFSKTPRVFQRSPPRNGLCKMCNINQQLKVAQLANFCPINEKKYDEEIEVFKVQLEKAYKLCSPCKSVLQMKLHKEKETLLGYKLLQTRTPEKIAKKKLESQNIVFKNLINNTSKIVAFILLALVTLELYKTCMKNKFLLPTVKNITLVMISLIERMFLIIKAKVLMMCPILENYIFDMHFINKLKMYEIDLNSENTNSINDMTQKILGGTVCFVQILGNVWNVNKLMHTVVLDILWMVFVISTLAYHTADGTFLEICILKVTTIITLLIVYKLINTKTENKSSRTKTSPVAKKMFVRTMDHPSVENETSTPMESDDDVSLCKFGLHNFTNSSHGSLSPSKKSVISGRCISPKLNDSIWSNPHLNSTFCVNSFYAKSPSSISDTIFTKPSIKNETSFVKYQNLLKGDSDSDLDESIGSLCISSPMKKSMSNNNPMFSLRNFNTSHNFVVPTPVNRTRPLLTPSKLGHSTSWVAGGYWGSETDTIRPLFNNGSRSSSQSSGFESQGSSMNRQNVFSHPPSREESVYGDSDKTLLSDRFQSCNMSNCSSFQPTSNFSRVNSPVFPQMQYNNHVYIPQPKPTQHLSNNTFVQQNGYLQNNVFKTPGGLLKIPPNGFVSR